MKEKKLKLQHSALALGALIFATLPSALAEEISPETLGENISISGENNINTTSEFPFTDVNPEDWYYSSVIFVKNWGLMSGSSETTFSPHSTITRGMLVTILHSHQGKPKPNNGNPFHDVVNTDYFATAAAWASENGLVTGTGEGEFSPYTPVSNEQMVTIIHGFANYLGETATPDLKTLYDVVNVSESELWSLEATAFCVEMGLLADSGGNYHPKSSATRGELAYLLEKFSETYDVQEKNPDPFTFEEEIPPVEVLPEEIIPETTPAPTETPVYGAVVRIDGQDITLNCRKSADADSEVLTTLVTGQGAQVLSFHENGWYKISFQGVEGYVAQKYFYVTDEDFPTLAVEHSPFIAYLPENPVYLYETPSTSAKIIHTWDSPSLISIYETTENWYGVDQGYVEKSQVKLLSRSEFLELNAIHNQPSEILSGVAMGEQIAEYAQHFVGYPYVEGGTSTDGFDCAGLAQYIFRVFGIEVLNSPRSFFTAGVAVEKSQLMPGDVLIFGSISHVGIYIGNNKFVHASTPTNGIMISSLTSDYYVKNYHSARRLWS